MKNKQPLLIAIIFLWGLCVQTPILQAEEGFNCEVMSLDGSAFLTNNSVSRQPLKEGDILKTDDTIEVAAGGAVDVAYDGDWQNVTRLEENTNVKISSLYPTVITLDKGGIYAKLKSLPKESTFEVQTPTAIASVRGSEYRTTFQDGATEVFNLSDSGVYVFGKDENGEMEETPTIIKNSERTGVVSRGKRPETPRKMMEHEAQVCRRFQERVERKVHENKARGRIGKIHSMNKIEKMMHENSGKFGKRDGQRLASMEKSGTNPKMRQAMDHQDKMLNVMQKTHENRQAAQSDQGEAASEMEHRQQGYPGNQNKDMRAENHEQPNRNKPSQKTRKPEKNNARRAAPAHR